MRSRSFGLGLLAAAAWSLDSCLALSWAGREEVAGRELGWGVLSWVDWSGCLDRVVQHWVRRGSCEFTGGGDVDHPPECLLL